MYLRGWGEEWKRNAGTVRIVDAFQGMGIREEEC